MPGGMPGMPGGMLPGGMQGMQGMPSFPHGVYGGHPFMMPGPGMVHMPGALGQGPNLSPRGSKPAFLCTVDGCQRPPKKKGLCEVHWAGGEKQKKVPKEQKKKDKVAREMASLFAVQARMQAQSLALAQPTTDGTSNAPLPHARANVVAPGTNIAAQQVPPMAPQDAAAKPSQQPPSQPTMFANAPAPAST